MPNSILIIGASARAAAQSAAAAGLSVFAIDQFGDQDTRTSVLDWQRLNNPDQLPMLVHSFSNCDILPVGGFESWQNSFSQISPSRSLLAASPNTVRQLRSLDFLREVASAASVNFPETREFQLNHLTNETKTPNTTSSTKTSDWTSDWLLKLPSSSAGLGVHFQKSQTADATEASHSKIKPSPETAWWQRRVPGKPYGASFLSTGTTVQALGVCRSLTHSTPSHPFLYAGSVGPVHVPESAGAQLQRLAENITNRTNLRGLFGIDFIFDATAQQLWLLEINPRYTASMELLDPGGKNSLVKQHVDAYRNFTDRFPFPTPFVPSALPQRMIKKVVWAKQAIPAVALQNFLDQWHDSPVPAQSFSHISVHDIPLPRDSVAAGTPVLTIISRASSSACSWFRQYREVLNIEQQLYSQRPSFNP